MNHNSFAGDACTFAGNIHANGSLASFARVSDLVLPSYSNRMAEALTDERFSRFMERMVFFTPATPCFMSKVRTPYVSTLYHHLAVAPKAEMRTSTLGILYMHCLIRPDVGYRVLNVRNHSFRSGDRLS